MPASNASPKQGGCLPGPPPSAAGSYRAAALLLWPRLDPDGLRRAGDDPLRLARLAERRTGIPRDEIIGMLERVARTLPPNPPARRRVPVPIVADPERLTGAPPTGRDSTTERSRAVA